MTQAQTAFLAADKALRTMVVRTSADLLRVQEAYFAALRAVVAEMLVTP